MIGARFRGVKPLRCIAARHDILLDAKSRQEKAVDNIFRRERELDGLADGHVQLVDFAIAFLVLDFPHPLFAHDIDLGRIWRHARHAVIDARAPDKNEHGDEERNDTPGDLDAGRGSLAQTTIRPFASAVFEEEVEHRTENDQHEKGTECGQEPKEIIDLRCCGGGLRGKNRKLHPAPPLMGHKRLLRSRRK